MPITRADLKISRNHRNRIAFAKYRLFASIAVGTVITGAMLTIGIVTDLDWVMFLTFITAFVSGVMSCTMLNVHENPKKRLARLMVENTAHREWDRALGYSI
jgi:hypothetical protein